MRRRVVAVASAVAAMLCACSSDNSSEATPSSSTTTALSSTTTAASSTTTAPPTAASSTTVPTTDPTTTAAPTTTASALAFPGDDWQRASPTDLGFDPAALDSIIGDAQAAGSNCLVVVRHGQLAGEWYWNGTDATTAQEVWSVTKSVTSSLVGIAADEGVLQLSDPAGDYIPAWQGTDSATVTIEDLLSNDSGRFWSFDSDYVQMATREADQSGYAIGLGQQHMPGQVWAYNNAAIQTLSEVLQDATGQEPGEFAEERLFEPIGMADTWIRTDQAGNTLTYAGVQSTCLDLARFGLLYLNGGAWNGEQVVPQSYVDAAAGASSTELNAAYGYLWWLNREGPIASTAVATDPTNPAGTPHGQMVASAPEDMFWAIGLGNQIVQVDPGSNTVVVRLGPTDLDSAFGPAQTARVVTEALS